MMSTLDRLRSIHSRYAVKLGTPESVLMKAGDEATILLYRDIMPSGWGGISAEDFAKSLNEANGAKRIHLRINSVGGVVMEAKAMLSLLRATKAEKVVHVDGLAASAATIVAMAGDKIITAPEATWFIHPAMALLDAQILGTAKDLRDLAQQTTSLADTLDRETQTIVDLYAKRTGQSAADIQKWIDPECEMTAQMALDRGFTDEIESDGQTKDSAEDKAQRIRNLERLNELRKRASPQPSPASRDQKNPKAA
jgi:ATP-dependent Clp protease protease subunit